MDFYAKLFLSFLCATILACGSRQKGNETGINQFLPADIANDQPRDYSKDVLRADGQFTFNTLLTTDLSLDLKLYDGSSVPTQQLTSALIASQVQHTDIYATVILKNAATKKVLFAGRTDKAGHLEARLQLPAHVKDAILTIVKNQYHERNLLIEKIAEFSKIERGMGMLKSQDSQLNNTLPDRDGDLIPDVYDAFPTDASRAFRYTVPADDFLSVAFEDNFPQLGDGDYNDFIARYRVEQVTNAANAIVELSGDVNAVAKLAGYDHRFGIFINFAGNQGTLEITRKNHLGINTGIQSTAVADKANVVLFEHTQQAFTNGKGHGAYFRIVFASPVAVENIDAAPFDPYLYVHNTGYDVHLLGKSSLPSSHNPPGSNGFRDANGFPRGLLVPTSWYYPKEGKFIDAAYPKFSAWRQSSGQQNSDWFLFPVEANTVAASNEYADRPAVILPTGFDPAYLQLTTEGVTLPDKLGGSYVPVGKVYNVTMTNGQNNFGNDFARIEYAYNLSALQSAGLLEEFQVFYFDAIDKKWKPTSKVIVDTATQRITAYTNHFTPFVLTAVPSATGIVPLPPACISADFPSGIGGSGGAVFSLVDENFKYLQDRPTYFIEPVNLPSPENAAAFADLGLEGAMGISTCNGTPPGSCGTQANHKLYTGTDYINFTAHTNIDVYVLYDTRGGTGRNDVSQDAPWLTAKGFTVDIKGDGGTAPDYFVQTTDGVVYYTVYKKTYAQGQVVSLDGNRWGVTDPGINTNYWVIVKPAGNLLPNSATSLCVAAPDTNPPAKVTNLSAIPGATNVTLLWQTPADPDFAGVVIRRSTLAPPADINEGTEPTPNTIFSPEAFRDNSAAAATTYFYTVFALDANNNRQIGESIMVVTGADSDGDGLADAYENATVYATTLKSNPAIADTDGDGITDGVEVANGTDPTNPDNIKPTVTAFSATSPLTTSNTTVTFTLTAADNTAVSAYVITLNNNPPLANNSNWGVLPSGYTLPAPLGTYTLYAWAKDAAGNVSNVASPLAFTLIAAPSWVNKANMAVDRGLHTATLLGNGQVLVVGGESGFGSTSAVLAATELYNPVTNTFSPAASMAKARYWHTTTLLSSGQVLVAGGFSASSTLIAAAELYDPLTNTFNIATSMAKARDLHTATLLSNGKVLITGGESPTGIGITSTAEIYDPAMNTFAPAASMATARYSHTATLLGNGKVLVAGGSSGSGIISTTELYDLATNTFSPAASMMTQRAFHTATLLGNGKVLIAGGEGGAIPTAELYDPLTNTFSPAPSMQTDRSYHTATLLGNGRVLIAGGRNGSGIIANAELYDPLTNIFTSLPNMLTGRAFHTAALLGTSRVLVIGGASGLAYTATTELFE